MPNLTNYPLLVFVVSFFGLTFSAWIGNAFHKWRNASEEAASEDFRIIQGATLTLLGLIIGFSFSMALNRYDQRKNYEEAEANAIGTEYVRAGLLPAADAAKIRAFLLAYLDQRILFYTERREEVIHEVNAQTDKLQTEMWSVTQTAALAQPTPISALAVTGMNDVLNSQGYTQAAWWNRIPFAAWIMMAGIALAANVQTGLGLGFRNIKEKSMLPLVLPLVVSIALFLIADIDSPRRGLIHVIPQNLQSLSESLHASGAAPTGSPDH